MITLGKKLKTLVMKGLKRILTYLTLTLSILFIIVALLLNFLFEKNTASALSTQTAEPVTRSHSMMTQSPQSHASQEKLDKPLTNSYGQFVVQTRPTWRLQSNLTKHIEKLKMQAQEGDNQARYILAQNLTYCYHAPKDEQAFQSKLEQAYELSDADVAADRITQRFYYCQGIDTLEYAATYSYLEQAAHAGYVPAQEAIGKMTPQFFMSISNYDTFDRNSYIAIRDNFKQQQIAYLTQAVNHGSITAMMRLSGMSHSQNSGEHGYVKAYALNQLIMTFTQSNELYNRYARYNERLYSQLSQDEIQAANDLSAAWEHEIERNDTLFLAQ